MTYLINLVLAVLWTLWLSGANLASLHTLLLLDLYSQVDDAPHNACSLAGTLFMDLKESKGGANTWLKQRIYS